jgi:predicted phage replisome organizer
MDWIKIMCNILDHRKIKMIRKSPEGNTLVLLWLLLLSEAGKCNRGGYLMVSDNLSYTAETLSMVMDIPLPTVQLALKTFSELDMIDSKDGAIFIKNWRKYQSEDKLAARREKDRLRQQRHRQKEREKLRALPPPEMVSRDNHVSRSRDVTQENRQDKSREEQTTTEKVRLLLSGTSLAKISNQELKSLEKRHGSERLLQAADIAAETWRCNREDKHNPGGYLQSLCASLVGRIGMCPMNSAGQSRKMNSIVKG